MSKVLLPVTESITGDISALASAIHYPECWDTAAYPDLMSALLEVATWAGCSVCEPGYMRDREVIELRHQLKLVTGALDKAASHIEAMTAHIEHKPLRFQDHCRAQAVAARAALAAVREPALINGLTEQETAETMSVAGLRQSDPIPTILTETHLIHDTYKRVTTERRFAMDDLEYDLFAAGWKACADIVRISSPAGEGGDRG